MKASVRYFGFVAALLLGSISWAGCGDDNGPIGPGEFPDVRGDWTGQYSVTSCTILSGSDPFFCQDLFYQGSSRFHDLRLDQSRSRVVGTAWQGQVTGRVEGTVSELGLLTLAGQIGVGESATTTIEEWEAVLVGDSLVGGWTFVFEDNTDLGLGRARIDADFALIDPSVPNYDSCPVEAMLDQTDAVLGQLAAGDCQLVEDESYYDVYSVQVSAGDKVEIRTSSSDFDPVLFIFDLEQRNIACSAPANTVDCTYINTPDSVAAVALEAVVAETWLIVPNTSVGGETGGYSLSTRPVGGSGSTVANMLQKASLGARSHADVVGTGQPNPASRSAGIAEGFLRPPSGIRSIKTPATDRNR
ncbi:MAG: hypothetical protein PVI01_00255 [Gemmatimonadales bacterium]|jgi:hypothetical protein